MPSLQLRRGLAANRTNITPAAGELIFTTDTQRLYVGDGSTAGGIVIGGQNSGTVTSVDISGGTTGLSATGGPVTDSGTITLAGTLAVTNGGTGQTTANSAFNALAPSQTGNTGKFLTTDGTDTSWATLDSLPSQANNNGKVLVTNGTSASWSTVDIANRLYVTKGGNDSNADGSISKPFLTIGAALSYANTQYPVTVSSATHIAIFIGPGNYAENITINRATTHLFGAEGKLKSTFLNGSVTVEPTQSYQGIFQTNISLNNLFITGGASSALTLAGTVQCSLDVNNCYLYSDSGAGFTTTSTASGGNRIRLYNTDITTVGTAVTLNVTNTTNCIISYMTLSSGSTTNAVNLSGTITLSLVQIATTSATNVINVATGTVSLGYSAVTTTKANGNGINIAAGATVIATAVTYNVVAGTGKAVNGSAGAVYVRGGNYYIPGTNSGIGASVTTFNMQGEVAGTDIISAVPTSVGGTGLSTFGAANRALYSTSASAITAGTLPIAAGGTGGTTASVAINSLLSGVTSISIGAVGATYAAATTTITGNSSVSTPTPFPGNIVIVGGTQSLTNSTAGDVTLQGGTSSGGGVTTGGNVILNGGSAGSFPGYVAIQTYSNSTSLVERLRITSSGAWSVGSTGSDVGTSGQVLTSNGNAAPTWQTMSRVTSVAVSGGTTGLTTSDGPITSSGTITLSGTLAATNGGTAQSTWTTGDLLYASDSNTLSKLAIGTTNQVLTVVGGVPTWAAVSGGGSSDAGTLTGTTLASNVVSSSLTSVGTLSSLTVSGSTTFGTNYTETRTNVTSASSTTIDCSAGNIFNVTMNASITTLAFSNVPVAGRAYNMTLFLNQDATGSRTITWPAAVKWPSGTAPTLTTTGSKTDILNLVTHDGGTTWYGFVAGQNY
jgi:hypothetical protein